MIVHNVKVVVIGGYMEEKQCKAYQCGVAIRSAFAHSRYIDDRTCLYKGW